MSGIRIPQHDSRFSIVTAQDITLDTLSYCLHRGPHESGYELAIILDRPDPKSKVCHLDVILSPKGFTDSSTQRITIGPFPSSMTLAALLEKGLQAAPRLVALNTVLPRYAAQIYRSLNKDNEDQRSLLARIDADIERELKRQARQHHVTPTGISTYQEV